jgi:hypothetical protein
MRHHRRRRIAASRLATGCRAAMLSIAAAVTAAAAESKQNHAQSREKAQVAETHVNRLLLVRSPTGEAGNSVLALWAGLRSEDCPAQAPHYPRFPRSMRPAPRHATQPSARQGLFSSRNGAVQQCCPPPRLQQPRPIKPCVERRLPKECESQGKSAAAKKRFKKSSQGAEREEFGFAERGTASVPLLPPSERRSSRSPVNSLEMDNGSGSAGWAGRRSGDKRQAGRWRRGAAGGSARRLLTAVRTSRWQQCGREQGDCKDAL